MDASATADSTRLKEHLYRAEADRLLLQQKANCLDEERQQLSADVHVLQQQLASAHSAVLQLQQQNQQLCAANATLQVQVDAAVQEYRANDIICCGLRDTISRLQHQLHHTQETCKQQASEISTFAEDMQALRSCKAALLQQLSELQHQHQHLHADHGDALKQLSNARLELEDSKRRWIAEHGDLACMMQEVQHSKQQTQAAMEQQSKQLQDLQQKLQDTKARSDEFESEVNSVRDSVMVLGKVMGKQPRGQELPGHDDPVWAKIGPLGGVQFALGVVIKHTRTQDNKIKGMQTELTRLEDRVRSESAQQAELQANLYEVRGLYAKAVADRESLEARATRAEAEKAAADNNWQRANAQAAEDSARLQELQESVMSLTKQMQQLLPLQPRCSTLEVERDTAQHKLDRTQEQCDQLQRQIQQAIARETELRSSLDTYKSEHMELLAANAQLVERCQGLSKKVQVLEISAREGSLAAGQLEEAKKRLCSTQTQLEAMSDSHVRTLNRLETAKALLHGSPTGSGELLSGSGSPSSSPTSRKQSRHASRHTSGIGATSDAPQFVGTDSTAAAAAATGTCAVTISQQGRTEVPTTSAAVPSTDQPTAPASRSNSRSNRSQQLSVSVAGGRDSPSQGRRSPSPYNDDPSPSEIGKLSEDEIASLPPEVAAMLKQKGIEEQLSSKQKKWHDMKVSLLSYFVNQLRRKLLQQAEHSAQLEVQLLQQEAAHIKLLQQQEENTSKQCMAAVAEAREALQQVLEGLQEALYDTEADSSTEAQARNAGSSSNGSSHNNGSDNSVSNLAGWPSQAHEGLFIGSSMNSNLSTGAADADDVAMHCKGKGKQRRSWLRHAVGSMISNLHTVAADAVARAELIASRQDIAIQSDEPLQAEWLRHVAAIPAGASAVHALHQKAIAEVIVRIYVRALHQLEATWAHELQQRMGRPGSRMAVSPGSADGTVVAGPGGGVSSLFETMMAHYAQQQLGQQGQQRAWQAYDASLWKDPQGPVSRLILSCQPLIGSNTKAALFCRLIGTHRQTGRAPWGMEHWRHFLLLLHAVKRLIGGLWKGVLRDWASVAGAKLPLQCVHDLLGNVYNISELPALDRTPALLNSRQVLREVPWTGAAAPTYKQQETEAATAAACQDKDNSQGQDGQPGEIRGSVSSSSASTSRQQQQQQRGSVSGALQELLVDGPVGPAVDFDDLLGMLMQQFDAGLLPPNPLMEPRRLTDGSLANTNNAWGAAALEAAAAASGPGNRPRIGSPSVVLTTAGPGGVMSLASIEGLPGRTDSERSDWCLPASMSGTSGAGGWVTSRPTTGATSSPPSPAAAVLPRIRTPDSAASSARPGSGAGPSSTSTSSNLPAVVLQGSRRTANSPAASETGSPSNSGSMLGQSADSSGLTGPRPSSKVAFREAPRQHNSKSRSGLRNSNR